MVQQSSNRERPAARTSVDAPAPHPVTPATSGSRDRPGRNGVDAFDVPRLVGRARELALLESRWDEAAAGRGGVVALGGEPGIGKTSLAQAFAGLAQIRGAAARWGRCYEGEWVQPYAPWVELLAVHLRAAEPDRLRADLAELGPRATPLGRLLPALGPSLPAADRSASLGPDEERFRLHDAAARLLLAAARERPLLLVLDDLHWADRPSLALLVHLVRVVASELPDGRLLVVVAYRDGALGRDHPLTEALATLRRETRFTAVALKGLDQQAVTDLLAETAGHAVGPELGKAVAEESGGNPFYVREVMRHLLDEGALVEREGRWVAERDVRALGVPEGVRQVVGRRLGRLSAPARQLLDAAAVFTAEVDFAVLQELCGLPEAALLDALDEALAAQFLHPLAERPDAYRFSHAIVREALAAEWARNPSRAARHHRRAAEALERVHPGRPLGRAPHAAELAIQYHASRSLPGAERGVPAALAAAEQARAAFAHERTVAFYRIARDLAAGADLGDQGTILAKLATAEAEALLLEDAESTTGEALAALGTGAAAPPETVPALATLAASLKLSGAGDGVWRPLVERGLALLGEDRGLPWARLMLLRDPVAPIPSDALRAGRWLGFDPEAVDVARRLGGEDDYAATVDSFDPRTRAETHALIDLARTWTSPTARLRVLSAAANDLMYRHGAFREALDLWQDVQLAAERYGAVSWQAAALNQLALLFLALGEFAQARDAEKRAGDLMSRLGPQGGIAGETDALGVEGASSFAYFLEGDWAAIAGRWRQLLTPSATNANYVTTLNGPFFASLTVLAHARADKRDEATALLAALTPVLEVLDPAHSTQGQTGAVAFAADAVWTLDAREIAPAYRRLARRAIAAGVGDYPQTSNELTVARMATLLGDAPEARDAFARARTTLDWGGQRPLRAIADHDEALALLQLDPTNLAEAAALLEAALAAFRSLGMEGWADRAQSGLDAIAAGAGRSAYPAGLSEREAEVLRLIARGYPDRQIADQLFISPRTVHAHVRNLLTKTDRANRTDLSVWAVEHGLGSERS